MEEIWKPVAGNESYEVSNLGRVRYIKMLTITKSKSGEARGAKRYARVSSKVGKNGKVHQLVAEAFLGQRPEGYTIDHKDGNRENNRADNLEYVTLNENIERAIASGAIPRKRNWRELRKVKVGFNTKITEEQAHEIKLLLVKEQSLRGIASQFGVSPETIRRIKVGLLWRDA